MNLQALDAQAQERHLRVLALAPPVPDACLPTGTQTVALIGPDEPAFWPIFKASKEMQDGKADPMDRWSERILTPWASSLDATAIFPSDGPPYPPFIQWALNSGGIWQSPVGLLVHPKAGLFVSFRAALALPFSCPEVAPELSPCSACRAQPCLTACPVDALQGDNYDVSACYAHLSTEAGTDCRTAGCRARRACPISQAYGRVEAQSAFHMKAFYKS